MANRLVRGLSVLALFGALFVAATTLAKLDPRPAGTLHTQALVR